MNDMFRPTRQPARRIYDALAEKTKQRSTDVKAWVLAEREHAWSTVRDIAQQNGMPVPTMAQVEAAEQQALGHTDYLCKWAIGLAELCAKPYQQHETHTANRRTSPGARRRR